MINPVFLLACLSPSIYRCFEFCKNCALKYTIVVTVIIMLNNQTNISLYDYLHIMIIVIVMIIYYLSFLPLSLSVPYQSSFIFQNVLCLWIDIWIDWKLHFVFSKCYEQKKKFEIRSVGSSGGRKFAYYTESDVMSKYLLHIYRSTHMFQMAIQPKLMEIRHLDAEGNEW